MKFTTINHIKRIIVLSFILGMGATSFAGNTIGDVPTSPAELRTIERKNTPYTDSCDIEQNLVFYDKSPVYLRVGQPKTNINYVFDKTETYVIVYNQPLFEGNLRFPYVSNFVPSTSFEPDLSNILTVEATGAIFSGGAMTMNRNQIAGQIVTKNMERAALINNTGGSTLNYYYRLANTNFTLKNGTVKISIHPNITPKTSCTNYYVARCGDGVIDKPTGSSDGNGGIMTQGGTFLPRHSRSIKPNEVCDDGPLNGQPGKCKKDCSGYQGGSPEGASCTLTASPATIQPGQSVVLQASYSSGVSATISPTVSFSPSFTYPNRNGSGIVTPTTTTTYTLTVEGASGTTPATCSATVTIGEPQPQFSCQLSVQPSIITTGQIATIGWNITNGNFFGTYIYVTPQIPGTWPHWINANQYSGTTLAAPINTGTYTFTLLINNNTGSASCTGTLYVVDSNPFCSLTTSTPNITLGQTGILHAAYANANVALFTPNITGLNLIYPSRSASQIQVFPTSTTTYTLHVLGPGGGSGITCTTTIHVQNTGLTLGKELVTNILYHSGDLVSFKINFGNNSASTIHNVVITDYLPASLEYVNSQIYGVAPYMFGTGIGGSNLYVEYSGFSLAPGQQGYILITGRFRGYQYANQTLNNAFAKGDDTPMVYASALFYTHTPTANATVTKTSNKPSYYPGEQAQFIIAITNNGPDPINNITITDNRPTSPCITLHHHRGSNMPLTVGNSTNPYTRIYNGTLNIGQTLYLYLTGIISNDPTCVGTYVNNASISYTINNQTQTGSAQPLNFTVSTTPSSYMLFEKRLMSYGNNAGDPVVFELLYQNQGSATITNFEILDYRPGTLNFVSASPMPTTQTPDPSGTLLRWIITTPLPPNETGKIIINGTIK